MNFHEDERISRTDMFLLLAQIVSLRSTCLRARVGVVIVVKSRVVSMGYVGSPSRMPHCLNVGCKIGKDGGCERTSHAEANAISFAARNGIKLDGGILYSTLAPCLTCAKLLINAGIREVYYMEDYREVGGIALLESAGLIVEKRGISESAIHKIEHLSRALGEGQSSYPGKS